MRRGAKCFGGVGRAGRTSPAIIARKRLEEEAERYHRGVGRRAKKEQCAAVCPTPDGCDLLVATSGRATAVANPSLWVTNSLFVLPPPPHA